jgi:hypothetical protein
VECLLDRVELLRQLHAEVVELGLRLVAAVAAKKGRPELALIWNGFHRHPQADTCANSGAVIVLGPRRPRW